MRLFSRNSPASPAPSDTAAPTPTNTSAETTIPTPTGPVRILIVEDSPTQARGLQKILEEQKYRVEVARDGKEALDYLGELRKDRGTWTSFRPTLIISDIVMPEMEGTELCHHLKNDEDFKGIPVILLTSLTDAKEALRGLYNGADNLISKPYEPAFLLARIEDLLSTMRLGPNEADKMFTLNMDGRKYTVSAERLRVINSIFTVYETAIHQTLQLEEATRTIDRQTQQLQEAQRTIEQQKSQLESR